MVLLIATLMPVASAGADPMHLVLIIEHKEYKVNTTGKFTAYVYDKDKLADADSPPQFKIGSHLFNSTRKAAGTYEAQVTVNASDVRHDDWYGDYAQLGTTTVTRGRENQSDNSYDQASDIWTRLPINLPTGTPPPVPAEGLKVRCTVKAVTGDYAQPGGTVTVESQVTFDGNATDPDGFNYSAVHYMRGGGQKTEYPEASKTGPGKYECRFTIPTTNSSTSITIYGTATRGPNTAKSGVYGDLNFLNVIYHNVRKGATETAFEVWIADALGKAVGGAHLDLGFHTNTNSRNVKWVDCGNTSAKGRVEVVLQYPNDTKSITVQGFVNTSTVSQSFSGQKISIVPSTVSPSGTGFEVARNEPARIYPTGKAFEMEFIAFNNSAPWAGKTLYAYVTFAGRAATFKVTAPYDQEVRTIQTGADGTFGMKFPAMGAETDIAITFKSATGAYPPGGYYTSTDGLLYSSSLQQTETFKGSANQDTVELTVEKLNLGGASNVRVKARSGDLPVIMAGWSMDQAWGIDGASGTEWQQWVTIDTYLRKSGAEFSGKVFLPEFLPRDKTYTIDASTGTGLAMESLKPGEGTGSVAAGIAGIPWSYIYIIIIIVVVVIVLVVLMRLKRRSAPVPPSDVVNFAGAPAVTQPPAVPPGGAAAPGETAGPQGPGAPPAPPPPPPPQYQQPAPQQYPPPPPQYQQAAPQQYPPPPPQYQQAAPQQSPPPPPQYQQPAPQQYPQPPPQQYQQPAPQQLPPPPPQYAAQPAYVAAPPPTGPLPPPSRQGRMAMPNNAMCAFCNQWLLQGATGIMCHCGKCYHEHCAKIQEKCSHCGTKLAL
jgi:hypothetical protein